ncbi:Polygalacturonase [Granulicella rosea]|uniref:Polygalacturonase n=1 Tax=Granulicella rosea TaxID=474952 RepID=A0A239LXD3_9BACT|nr:Ig-like domain repeat protein [Granulicella rosea]SNT34940.1 Polygalacturonase [Granulicella rosea]
MLAHRLRTSSLAVAILAILSVIGRAYAQDTRTVVEPVFPPVCTVLSASLAQSGTDLPSSAENSFDTARIQAAMNACPAGKAVELAPSGLNNAFLTQPLNLVSGVTLIVDAGVTLFASRNPRDYDVSPGACGILDSVGAGCNAIITGNNVVNAGIMGYGTIDGRGEDTMIGTSTTWYGLANTADADGLDQNNPRMLQLNSSNNFTLYKITLKNPPKFHVSYSQGVGFTAWGVKIITPTLARNTDGIDPASAQNITITKSYISDGDDMIAVKSSGNQQAKNITISNSYLGAGHGISIGSEVNSGVSNIYVNNVSINQDATNTSQNGIRIKSDSSRGGLVTNVLYDGVCMQNSTHPLIFNPYYSSSTGSLIPNFTNITLRNFHSLGTGSMTFEGYSSTYPLGLTLDNVQIDGVKASNLSASYANITLGPGAVNFSPSGTGVNITNNITGTSTVRDCTNAFPSAAGELFATPQTTITGSTVPITFQVIPIVSPAANPTGQLYIMEGSNIVQSVTLNGITTSTQLLNVAAGTHTYTAAYQGDSTYPAMTFGSYIATVGNPTLTSATSLTASASNIAYQANVTFTAKVTATAGTITGNVTFTDGASQLATVAVDNTGTAIFSTNALASGPHSIVANYAGDSNHQGSVSTAVPVTVSASTAVPVTVGLTVTQPTGAITYGQAVTVTASLVPQTTTTTPGGTLTFTIDGVVQPAVALSGTTSSVTITGPTTGGHSVSAVYSGDSVYAMSTSSTLNFTVVPEPTTTTLVASTGSAARYQPVTFTANVSSPSAAALVGGSVAFTLGGTLLGSSSLDSNNNAAFTTSTLPAGSDNVVATYAGSTNEAASTSTAATVLVSTTVGSAPAAPQLLPYFMSTVAGTVGTASYGGDGAQATAASLNLPKGVSVDASGNLYIADSTNLVVRKVTAATGVITTVAGGGSATCSGATDSYGDGCAATSAPLYGPRGTATDTAGNFYIADYTKSEVRKVTLATGIISLYAGTGSGGYSGDSGPANQGAVHNPENLAFDAAGNLYIADTKNNVVRKVDTNGIITTLVGAGTAGYTGDGGPATESSLNGPNGVAFDNVTGSLYIADSANFVVRKVNAQGIISTYAGTGTAGLNQTSGIASQTQLKNPTGVGTDAIGNVYITDSGNNLVWRVDVLTQTMQPVAGASTLCAGATDAIGDGCPALQAKVSGTSAVVADAAGNLYLADTNNDVIRKVANNTSFAQTAVGSSVTQTLQAHFGPGDSPASTSPFAISGGTGNYALAGTPTCVANADSTQDCTLAITFTPTASGLRTATLTVKATLGQTATFALSGNAIVLGAAASISVAVTTPSNQILIYGQPTTFTATVTPGSGSTTPTGTVTFILDGVYQAPVTMSGGTASISPVGLAVGSHSIAAQYSGDSTFGSANTSAASNVTVGKATTATGLQVTTQTAVQGTSITLTATTAATPTGAIAPSGTVNFLNGIVLLGSSTLNSNGVATFTTSALPVGNDSITAAFPATASFATSTSVPTVITITAAPLPQLIPYIISTVAGTPGTHSYLGDGAAATAATLNTPQGLFVDASSNIYIGDSSNNVIRKVNAATGVITTVAGGATTVCTGGDAYGDGCPATQAILTSPRGIAVDASGDIFIADQGKSYVRRVDGTTGLISIYAGTGSTGFTGDGGQSTLARLKSPQAVDIDRATGNLYVSDSSNYRVRQITPAGIINTSAGYITTGTFAGDGFGATATTAALNLPGGAAVDPSGNLLIADRANNRIRKVNASAILSTIAGNGNTTLALAGGSAVGVAINAPYGVTSDALGNLYIADSNNVVWRLDAATQYMYVVAGGGTPCSGSYGDGCPGVQAKLSKPYQLSFDSQGNLYIADSGDYAIRKLSLNTTFPSTQAGATTTQTLQVHFAPGETPATSNPYSFSNTNFTAGTATCTSNTDTTTNCLLPVTFQPLTTGTLTANLTVTSNAGHAQTFAVTGVGIPGGVATTTTLTAVSPANGTISYGQTATISATVAPVSGSTVPTGKITFTLDGVAQTPAVTLSSAVANLTLTGLSVGSHFLSASYNGDLANNASSSTVQLEIDVNPASTLTTLSLSTGFALPGASVTLTAQVTPTTSGTPTGSVAFANGATTLGYGTVSGTGAASYSTTALPAGVDSITATYVGDSHYTASTSSAATITISTQNVWVFNGNGTLSALTNAGAAISTASGYTGGGSGITIDGSGNVWSGAAGGTTVTEFSKTGALTGTYSGGGIASPKALAVTGAGSIWIANAAGTLSVLSSTGTALSPSTGYNGGGLSTPTALVIDASGNVWVANSGDSSLTEFLGAAEPVVTPTAAAVKSGTLGVQP